MKESNLNSSVCNAFKIINCLTGKDWCRIKDVAAELIMDETKVYRLMQSMLNMDYLEYDEITRRYRLGYKFYNISYHMSRTNSLLTVAREHMEWAASQLLETINLGVLSNSKNEVRQVYRIDCSSDLYRFEIPLGGNTFVYAAALGKCILAYMSPGEQRLIASKLEYKKFTENTVSSANALLDQLHEIRRNGYALDMGEFHPNIFCLATPIFSSMGLVVASISVSIFRNTPDIDVQRYYVVMNEAASRISQALGYTSV